MDTLTIGLIAVGALVLVIILVYGMWSVQQNKSKKSSYATEQFLTQFENNAENAEHSFATDAAPNDQTLNTFATDTNSVDDTDNNNPDENNTEANAAVTKLTPDHIPTEEDIPSATSVLPSSGNDLLKRPALDPLIDSIVEIKLTQPVYGATVVSVLPKTWRVGSKPFSVEGFNTKTQEWEFPVAPAQYSAFQAGVQLANRSGALNEIEFSDFVQSINQLAEHLQCDFEPKNMPEEITKARELDQFASALDAQIGFILRSKSVPWKIDPLYQAAEDIGFLPSALAGQRVLFTRPEKTPLLHLTLNIESALSASNSTDSFRLFFEVTHVAPHHEPYRVLCDISQQLAGRLDAERVDEQDVPVQEDALSLIERDLDGLYQQLQARGFAAGSPLALRLFS